MKRPRQKWSGKNNRASPPPLPRPSSVSGPSMTENEPSPSFLGAVRWPGCPPTTVRTRHPVPAGQEMGPKATVPHHLCFNRCLLKGKQGAPTVKPPTHTHTQTQTQGPRGFSAGRPVDIAAQEFWWAAVLIPSAQTSLSL